MSPAVFPSVKLAIPAFILAMVMPNLVTATPRHANDNACMALFRSNTPENQVVATAPFKITRDAAETLQVLWNRNLVAKIEAPSHFPGDPNAVIFNKAMTKHLTAELPALESPFEIEPSVIVTERPAQRDLRQYRFFDRENFAEVASPLFAHEMHFFGKFIAYQKDYKLFVQLIGDTKARFVQNADWQKDHEETPQQVVRISADGLLLETNARDYNGIYRSFYEYNAEQGQYVSTRRSFETDLKDESGVIFKVRDQGANSWTIVDTKTGVNQTIQISDARITPYNSTAYARVEGIFGQGTNRVVIIAVYESPSLHQSDRRVEAPVYYRVPIGTQPRNALDRVTKHPAVTQFGNRFLQFNNFFSNTLTVVDIKTGETFQIGNQDRSPYVDHALLNETTYASFLRGTGTTVVKFRDIKTHAETHSAIALVGRAELIAGTRIIRTERFTDSVVSFVDSTTGQVLWIGSKALMPTLSSDGSRLAFYQNGQVQVVVLGDGEKPESRRTF